jgi:hypothetical protein
MAAHVSLYLSHTLVSQKAYALGHQGVSPKAAIFFEATARWQHMLLTQLRHAPIKFGRFIKLYNINVKVLYKQTNMGFTAEAGFFWGGGKGAFCPKKRCNAPSAGYGFLRK